MSKGSSLLATCLLAVCLVGLQIRCGSSSSAPPPAAPAITVQPVAQTTVLAPATATFSVTATGNPAPTYAWSVNGTPIAGATAASYDTGPTTAAMDGNSYTVTVSNGVGSPAVSSAAVLTVHAAPLFTTEPASTTAVSGATATFTAVATGSPTPTYQWYLNGSVINGANSASYTTGQTSLADDGESYTVSLHNTYGDLTSSPAAILTVDQAPAISAQPQPATVTVPAPASFSVTATGNPLSYQWNLNGSPITGATGSTFNTGATTALMNNNSYSVTVSGAGSPVTSNAVALTVQYPVQITSQPVGASVTEPAGLTLTVAASGNPAPTYQWYLGSNAIGGATSASYNTGATVQGQVGFSYPYKVVVSNGIGSPVTSSVATMTVDEAPTLTSQPAAQTVTAPAPATFSVSATGYPLNYQWFQNGVAISGATSATYTTGATAPAMNGSTYQVSVSGVGTAATSSQAVLTVDYPAAITTQPSPVTVTAPAQASFTVAATGNPLTYQWNLGGIPITGANAATYTIPSTTGAMNGGSYSVTVGGTGTPVTSTAATLTVDYPPAITTPPSPVTVTAPAPAAFTVVATGYPLNYQWNLNGVPITGANAATYSIPATSGTMNGGSYSVTVTGTGNPVTSAPAALTVNYPPTITTQPSPVTVTAPAQASFTVAATGYPLNYQWLLNNNPIVGANSATYTIPATDPTLNGGSYSVVVLGTGSPATSIPVTLTVDSPPVITSAPSSVTVTAPAPAAFTVAATGYPLNYQWNLNGVAIPGANAATYNIPATSGSMNGGSYTVTVSGIGNPATSTPATLTVNYPPTITSQPSPVTVTAPAQASFTVAATGYPLNYQWLLNGNPIGGANSATYTIPTTIPSMNGGSYSVVVFGTGSPATSIPATLTVDSPPVITSAPSSVSVTAPAPVAFTVVATGYPLNYQWYLNGSPIAGANAATYNIPATSGSMNGGSYTVTVFGTGAPATTMPVTLTVFYPPTISVQPANQTTTVNGTATFSVTAAGNPVPSYQWYENNLMVGSNAPSYTTVPATTGMNNNTYYVVVSNGMAPAAISTTATLTVNNAAAITTPPADQLVTAPGMATFNVVATGLPTPTYVWNLNGVPIVPAATGSSYTTPATSLAMNGNLYSVTVTNGLAAPVTSAQAKLTVDVAPAITSQPSPSTITLNSGAQLYLTVAASGNPATFTYQWYHNNNPVTGATSYNYSVASVGAGDAGTYYVTVDNTIAPQAQSSVVTVTVNQAHAVSGNINLMNNYSTAPPPVTLTISTNPVQTTSSDGSGNYTFAAVPPGGPYTITPSITGPSSVFYPASLNTSVGTSDVNGLSFQVALGYNVSGSFTYGGSHAPAWVYVTLNSSNGNSPLGTSVFIPSTGTYPFTISGVPPGSYTLAGRLDDQGDGSANFTNPTGTQAAPVTVTAQDVVGQSVTLVDHGDDLTNHAGPGNLVVSPMDSGVAVSYSPITNSNGVDLARKYTLQWNQSADFTGVGSTVTFNANENNVFFNSYSGALVNGTPYYFRLRGQCGYNGPTTYSNWTYTTTTITVNPGSGSNTVSGTISFTGTPTGTLYVGLFDQSTGHVYAQPVQTPASGQTFSVSGVPSGSSYYLFGVIDQDNNGLFSPGDITNVGSGGDGSLSVTADLPNQSLVLPSANATVVLTTGHSQNSGANDNYNLNFRIRDGLRHVTGAVLVSGPNILPLTSIGLGNGNNGLQYWASLAMDRPTVGDTYDLKLTYDNLASEDLYPSVTTVLDSFAQNLAPTGTGNGSGTGLDVQPSFSWTAPAAPPSGAYSYSFWLQPQNGGSNIWQVPGNNSKSNGLDSTVLSLIWGTDPTDGSNLPSPDSLSVGTAYNWAISVQDSNGNQAQQNVTYTP